MIISNRADGITNVEAGTLYRTDYAQDARRVKSDESSQLRFVNVLQVRARAALDVHEAPLAPFPPEFGRFGLAEPAREPYGTG